MNDLGKRASITRSQWSLIFLILAVTAGSVMYRLIVRGKLEQTAVLFIGIPAVLAILLSMMPKTKTVTGGIMKGLTLALLLSGPLLDEGFICILMTSPLFYLVGLLVGAIVDLSRKERPTTLSCLLLILLPMSIEGSSPRLSFNREETVQASQVVNASERDVQVALRQVNSKENGDHPSYSSFMEAQDWKDSPKHCPSEVEIDRHSAKQSALCIELPPAEVEVEQLDCKQRR